MFEEFDPVSKTAWKEKIIADLKGKEYDSLQWMTEEGFSVDPFYTSEDMADLKYLNGHPALTKENNDWEILTQVDDQIAEEEINVAGLGGELSITDQIAFCLANGYAQLGSSADPSKEQIIFRLPIGSNYFMELAKFRALRVCWHKLASDLIENPTRPKLIGETSSTSKAGKDPYDNLIRATTECMSAVIGGCDAVVVKHLGEFKDQEDNFADRMGKNIQLILKEEAKLGSTHVDPAAGSYFIERLTHLLAEKAWQNLQRES